MASRLGAHTTAAMAALEQPDATSQLRLNFPNHTVTKPGTPLTKTDATADPALWLSGSGQDQPKRFLAISVDLDAPFPSFPILGPILHSVQTDLTPGAAQDGWTPLVAGQPAVVGWIPPNPPPPSSAHRYVFLVWEQPAGLEASDIRKALGQGEADMARTGRMRWDGHGFEAALKLGPVVAANFFWASR